MAQLTVRSSAFETNKPIPKKYGCQGDNISPPVSIEGVPKEAKTLALLVDDPDAVGTFDHWVVWNIPIAGKIAENSVPGTEGLNGAQGSSYLGPCPPSGTHRYFFKLYALDTKLEISTGSKRDDLEKAMKGHVLASAEMIGLYSMKA